MYAPAFIRFQEIGDDTADPSAGVWQLHFGIKKCSVSTKVKVEAVTEGSTTTWQVEGIDEDENASTGCLYRGYPSTGDLLGTFTMPFSFTVQVPPEDAS